MAKIVCSVVADEAARKLSSLLSGENGDREISHEHKVERLEMAVLKLQTVLAVSDDYLPLTHRPLIRWKAKLKRVAKEGKGVLRSHKKQIFKSKRRNKSFWQQSISRAAKLFVPFVYGAEELSLATVKRFERLADHASDFIKFVEHGGGGGCARSLVLSLPSLTRSLGAGEAVERSVRIRSGTGVLLLQPWWLEEHDEGNTKIACLWMSYDHDVAWEKSLKIIVAFYLSDTVDIMKVAMNSIDLLPSQFCTARAAMKELLAEMALHGRSSPAPSPLYLRFVRGIQNSHRYGFASNPQLRCSGGRLQLLPEPILLACAHFYVTPTEKSNRAAAVLELVWHASPSYLPRKLSEHHEVVGLQEMDEDVIPKVANGFFSEEGAFNDHERQWWCPQSSTRLLVAPLLSPPRTLPQWCERQKQEHSTSVSPPTTLPTAGQFFQESIKK